MHDCIKQHALQVAEELADSLGTICCSAWQKIPPAFGLPELQLLLTDSERLVGSAPEQVNTFLKRVARLVFEHPNAQAIKPEPLL